MTIAVKVTSVLTGLFTSCTQDQIGGDVCKRFVHHKFERVFFLLFLRKKKTTIENEHKRNRRFISIFIANVT